MKFLFLLSVGGTSRINLRGHANPKLYIHLAKMHLLKQVMK